jgi:hypothetical protein
VDTSVTFAQAVVLGLYVFSPMLVPPLIVLVIGVTAFIILGERERDRKRREARSVVDKGIDGPRRLSSTHSRTLSSDEPSATALSQRSASPWSMRA